MVGGAEYPRSPYRILGELEVGLDGTTQPLPPGLGRTILTTLLLSPNRRLSTVDLMLAGWGHARVARLQLE